MIQLQKLELHKYLSFLDSKLELNDKGIIMVTGENNLAEGFQSNGSGKSTLLSGVPFALYGKTLNGLKADDVINRNFKKDCYVKLTFKDTESGTTYRVERYRKDTTNKNRVLLFADDKDITEATTAKTEAHIEEVVGIDYVTYVTGIHVGKTDGVPLFADASDGEKKKILENIANTQVYEKAHEVALNKLKDFQTDLKIKQSELSMGTQSLNNLNLQQDRANEQAEKAQAEVGTLSVAIAEAEKSYQSDKDNCDNQVRQEEIWQHTYKEKMDSFSDQQQLVSSLNAKINEINRDKVGNETNIKYLNQDIINLRQSYMTQFKSTNCPVCGAPLDEDHRKQELDRLTKEGQDKTQQLKEEQVVLERNTQLIKQNQDLLTKTQDELSDYGTLSNKYSSSLTKVNSLKNALSNKESQLNLDKQRLENANNQLQSITNWDADIRKQDEANKLTQAAIDDLDGKIERYTKIAKNVFSNTGVRAYVLQSITPFLNQKANLYLSALTGSTMRMELSTQTETKTGELKDKFSIDLFDNYDKKLPYKGASTGERKRVDLSISFAIRDLIISRGQSAFNVAIYDECFDGLDAVGMEQVLNLLNKEQNDVGTIFVISHNDNLKSMFDKSLIISKDTDGNSKIVSQETL